MVWTPCLRPKTFCNMTFWTKNIVQTTKLLIHKVENKIFWKKAVRGGWKVFARNGGEATKGWLIRCCKTFKISLAKLEN